MTEDNRGNTEESLGNEAPKVQEVKEVSNDKETQKVQETLSAQEPPKVDVVKGVGPEAIDPSSNCLKVKADPPDLPAEERKKRVKKLAGAISHSLRNKGEINVRCFGSASIGKAAKALAIARKYISVQSDNTKRLRLECSPAFITTKIGDNQLTGICFVTFASELSGEFLDVDLSKVKSVLKVTSDPKDISDEERKIKVKKLAGAISHSLEENKEVVIRCFGNATIGKASKALAIARGFVATRGPDLYCWPDFIVTEMGVGEDKQERTGIAWYAYTNEA